METVLTLAKVEKLICSLYKNYYRLHNIDRSEIRTFIDSALEEAGLKINHNYELINRDTQIGDIIREKNSGIEFKIVFTTKDKCWITDRFLDDRIISKSELNKKYIGV